MHISTPPRPKVENFQMKTYYPAGDRTPDLLNQRQTCYHLSQHGELEKIVVSPVEHYLFFWCGKDAHKILTCLGLGVSHTWCEMFSTIFPYTVGITTRVSRLEEGGRQHWPTTSTMWMNCVVCRACHKTRCRNQTKCQMCDVSLCSSRYFKD